MIDSQDALIDSEGDQVTGENAIVHERRRKYLLYILYIK